MSCLMLTAVLAFGLDPQQAPPQPAAPAGQHAAASTAFDGTWHVLLAEKDGQKLDHQTQTVTIKGNVLTWTKDGKEHQVQLQFGPNHMLSATPEAMHQNAQPAAKSQPNATPHQPATPAAQTNQQPGQAQAQANQPTPAQPNPAQPNQPAAKPGEQAQANNTKAENQPKPAAGNGQFTLPTDYPGHIGGAMTNSTPDSRNAGRLSQSGHHGVYVCGGEYLCLALNDCFMEDKAAPATAAAPKAGAPTRANPNAKPAANQVAGQPATPAPGANAAVKPSPAPANTTVASNQQQPGQQQATRQANYGPMGQMERGFVLILQRQGGSQPLQR